MFPKIQIQLAQLEVAFNGPLIKDSQVNNVNDLISLSYNYLHKIVWVISEKTNYFLNSGDGSELSHWKKFTNTLTIEQYASNETYDYEKIVYLGGKIYKALQAVPLNYNPIDYPLYWLLITGETITYRYIFDNLSSVIVYSTIKNPIFTIIIGTFETVDNQYVLDSDGLIKINNPEIIEADIKRRNDIPDNNGQAFEISFEENSLPIQLTGTINIK